MRENCSKFVKINWKIYYHINSKQKGIDTMRKFFEKFSLNFPVAISYYSNGTKRNSFNLTYIELQMVMKKVLNYS